MKILNFGSLNIDFVYSVNHIVNAGETISSNGLELFCGGKGLNQSVALSRAGASVYHAGMVGEDGGMLLDMCDKNGVNKKHIKTSDVRTGNAIIQVDSKGENCIMLFGGANKMMTKDFVDEVLLDFEQGDLIVLQNEINLIDYIIDKAYEKGMLIALNPSPYDDHIKTYDLSKITYFILNEIEGCELTGETEPNKILHAIIAKYPHSKTVLTLGKSGCTYMDKEQEHSQGIYNVDAMDTTAAGDTFLGYFLSAVTRGGHIENALEAASKAAAIAVSRKGASSSIPFLCEVNEF